MNKKKLRGIVLICARSGSQRLKNKNLRNIKKIPLIGWSIKAAKKLSMVEKIIVSSDSKKILKIAKKYGAETPFIRPKNLANSRSNEFLVWKHALDQIYKIYKFHPDFVISLPPTCPTRSVKDIENAYKLYKKNNFKTVISICESYRSPYFNIVKLNKSKSVNLFSNGSSYHRSQDVPKTYDITTAFYIANAKFILKSENIFSGKVGGYIVNKINGIDIDDELDFKLSKIVL